MIHWKELSTDQRIDAIKAVWQPKMSAAQIAAAIPGKVSRNAIIGVFHRHGSKMGPVALSGSRGAIPSRQPRPRSTTQRKPRPPVFRPMIRPDVYDATALRLPLHELERGLCKWPVNDVERGGVFLFCGHQTDEGPYCADHHFRSVAVSILGREG